MSKHTSILLGNYYENFVNHQVQSGKFDSASEVVRAAMRLFEEEEKLKTELVNELIVGEESGFIKKIDKKKFIKNLHTKYVSNHL